FLIFRLGESARIALRPSGTEPKAKAYVEVCSTPRPAGVSDEAWAATCAAVDRQIQHLADEFLKLALGLVGIAPPPRRAKLSREGAPRERNSGAAVISGWRPSPAKATAVTVVRCVKGGRPKRQASARALDEPRGAATKPINPGVRSRRRPAPRRAANSSAKV